MVVFGQPGSEVIISARVICSETKHGAEIIKSIAATHEVCKRTLQHVKFMLSGVFVLAKNEGLFKGINPMTDVMLPDVRKGNDTHAYTLDQILSVRLPFHAAKSSNRNCGIRRTERV